MWPAEQNKDIIVDGSESGWEVCAEAQAASKHSRRADNNSYRNPPDLLGAWGAALDNHVSEVGFEAGTAIRGAG